MYICLFEIEVKVCCFFALGYDFLLSRFPMRSVCSYFYPVSIKIKELVDNFLLIYISSVTAFIRT